MASSLSDALLDGFVGQFYRETDGVRDLLQSLRDGTRELTLPQIVVVGQESSGKSSVLESLAMLPLFPRDEDICTRMPIHLKLRRGAVAATDGVSGTTPSTTGSTTTSERKDTPAIKMRLVYSDGRPPMEEAHVSLDNVVPLTLEWMKKVLTETSGAVRGIVDHVLEIHVTSPDVPTLDLIDLPGIVAGRLQHEPVDMMEQTRALVEKYLSMPHTLVLAVVPAKERVRNSQAFQLVQQIGLTHRAIGVLTMVDRAGDTSNPRGIYADVMERLDGTAGDIVQLEPHGYVAVMSRDARLRAMELPLAEFKPHETQWLKDNLPGYVERGLASSGVLAVKVAKMLTQHVRETWVPLTMKQLDEKVNKVNKGIDALGKSSATLVDELLNNDRAARVATLKQLLGPSLLRVANAADIETMKLVQLLREKMETRLRAREATVFFSSSAATSFAAEMTDREGVRVLLEENIQAIVTSALYRLASLVRREVGAQRSTPGDAYHTAVFENLYLLAASTMWPKAEALLMTRERVVDRVIAAMDEEDAKASQRPPDDEDAIDSEDNTQTEVSQIRYLRAVTEALPQNKPRKASDFQHSPAPLDNIKGTDVEFLENTMACVSSMLAAENLPLPLEAAKAPKCAPAADTDADAGAKADGGEKSTAKSRRKSKAKNKAAVATAPAAETEPASDEESARLFFGISRHVVAPLLRELMDAGTMADATVGYLLRAPAMGGSPMHWFSESTALTRQEGIETVARLKAAREGVEGLLRLSE